MARDRASTVAEVSRSELAVPVGTQVLDRDSGALIADLAHPGARATLVRGGRGGKGNRHYATARHRAPEIAQVGEAGRGAVARAAPEAGGRRRPARVSQRRQIIASARDLECQAEGGRLPVHHHRPGAGHGGQPRRPPADRGGRPGPAGRRQRRGSGWGTTFWPISSAPGCCASDRCGGRRRGYPEAARHDQPRIAAPRRGARRTGRS